MNTIITPTNIHTESVVIFSEGILPDPKFVPSYYIRRQSLYPSIADQLDLLYHGGYDAWKSAIQAIKDANPKPQTPPQAP